MKAVTTKQILDAARHVFQKSRSVTGLLLPKVRKSSAKSSNKKSSVWDKPVRVFGGNQ
jgi:predicted RNA binding protein with dsRBD fold (UPF0201 family)